jgi:hypothetical protein
VYYFLNEQGVRLASTDCTACVGHHVSRSEEAHAALGDPTLSTLANQVARCGFLDPWVVQRGPAVSDSKKTQGVVVVLNGGVVIGEPGGTHILKRPK